MSKLSSEATRWKIEYGSEMPLPAILLTVATYIHESTLKPGVRPLSLCILIGGVDPLGNTRLFRVNAAGDVKEGREFVAGEADFGAEELREVVDGEGEGEVIDLLKGAMSKRSERLELQGYSKGAFEHTMAGSVSPGDEEARIVIREVVF